jgi:hypothetical protein
MMIYEGKEQQNNVSFNVQQQESAQTMVSQKIL